MNANSEGRPIRRMAHVFTLSSRTTGVAIVRHVFIVTREKSGWFFFGSYLALCLRFEVGLRSVLVQAQMLPSRTK